MPSLREITVFAHALDVIDDEEFALLYDATKPKSHIEYHFGVIKALI
jgi:hypothetical protein